MCASRAFQAGSLHTEIRYEDYPKPSVTIMWDDKTLCRVHERLFDIRLHDIRQNVCVDDESLTAHTDGWSYCIFHLPDKEKDIRKFEEKFQTKLRRIEYAVAENEKLSKDQRNVNRGVLYDFRYIRFPTKIDFKDYQFRAAVDFSFAAFSSTTHFDLAVFSADASFRSAVFSANSSFRSGVFSAGADFISATFLAAADFNSATFSALVNFHSAAFSSDLDFRSAVFSADAHFGSAVFSGASHFNSTVFSAEAVFVSATFGATASFSSVIFSAVANFSAAAFSDVTYFSSAAFSSLANFNSTVFSSVAYFTLAVFSSEADFRLAIFSADAVFRSTAFLADAYFDQARFSENRQTYFNEATFGKDTFFDDAEFRNEVSFNLADFGEQSDLFFRNTLFADRADFRYCMAEGYLRFDNLRQGDENKFDFQEAAFENAIRISFHTVRLRPHWFLNCNCRNLIFTACNWNDVYGNFVTTKTELKDVEKYPLSHKLLTKTCWQLADNHEEMKSFLKASFFRQMANESKRLEENGGWKVWSLHWWYWLSSFYGERPLQAGVVLMAILLIFAFVFGFLEFQVCLGEPTCQIRTLFWGEAVMQSLATATFQSIEYIKPKSSLTAFVVVLEKIFAPLQAALLALAIRRKFMR